MSNNVNQNVNSLLENYKDLVVSYEESRKNHEDIIDTFEQSEDSDPIACSTIVAYVRASEQLNWIIELLDGSQVYKSSTTSDTYQTVIDLSTLNLDPYTQLKFKAYINTGNYYVYANETLEYIPRSSTIYYDFDSSDDDQITYLATIDSSANPPLLQCSSLSVYCDGMYLTKYEIRLASTGKSIFTSGDYGISSTWNKSLADLNIASGTQLTLHAGIIGGNDCDAYLIISYNTTLSTEEDTGCFKLYGNTHHSSMMFTGTK